MNGNIDNLDNLTDEQVAIGKLRYEQEWHRRISGYKPTPIIEAAQPVTQAAILDAPTKPPSAKCEECEGEIVTPFGVRFCSSRCYHKSYNKNRKNGRANRRASQSKESRDNNPQLPLSPQIPPKTGSIPKMNHFITLELLKIAGISITPSGGYVFSNTPYSGTSELDNLANLIPLGTYGSARRVAMVNKYMKRYLDADVRRARPNAIIYENSYCVPRVNSDRLTLEDKLIIREMNSKA